MTYLGLVCVLICLRRGIAVRARNAQPYTDAEHLCEKKL